ncbi:hypothetical protein FRB96_006504 [Tulasnella sp. 330]|nr:hypothetical protein FRB96_006504 [Tulasnella sp. 330]KAG8878772.1 hypothetical protein FRB97_002313 [Tulasnella sp. 331]
MVTKAPRISHVSGRSQSVLSEGASTELEGDPESVRQAIRSRFKSPSPSILKMIAGDIASEFNTARSGSHSSRSSADGNIARLPSRVSAMPVSSLQHKTAANTSLRAPPLPDLRHARRIIFRPLILVDGGLGSIPLATTGQPIFLSSSIPKSPHLAEHSLVIMSSTPPDIDDIDEVARPRKKPRPSESGHRVPGPPVGVPVVCPKAQTLESPPPDKFRAAPSSSRSTMATGINVSISSPIPVTSPRAPVCRSGGRRSLLGPPSTQSFQEDSSLSFPAQRRVYHRSLGYTFPMNTSASEEGERRLPLKRLRTVDLCAAHRMLEGSDCE